MQPATLQQAPDRRIGAWLVCLRALRRPAVLDQAIEGKRQVLFRAFWPLIVSLGLILGTPTTRAEEGVASESQMKAAFLVNFPKYVDWPSSAFAHPNSPVIVAIFGDDKVVEEFGQMIGGGRTINGRRIELKRISAEEEISKECQILYVGASERRRVPAILEKLKAASVLTVSETDNFLEKGGVINLIRKDQNVRLAVNLNAAGQARLKISSSLLSVADVVVKAKPN